MINGKRVNGTGHATSKSGLTWGGGLLLAVVIGAVCFAPAAANAAFIVSIDLNSARLDYDQSDGILTITENLGSDILIRHEDGNDVLDTAKIVGGTDFDFTFELEMTSGINIDEWTSEGSLKITDTDTSTNAVFGDFVSDSISITTIGSGSWQIGVLQIEGQLSNNSPSMLQNRGDPWEYVGEETIPGEHTGDGLDGVPGQISVNNPTAYDDGIIFVLKFGVDTNSLDTLFGSDFVENGGEVKGFITPEPATMTLLLIGGSIIAARRRRRHAA
jgi:hypothetical protein